jgi:hypothetical protein
MFPACVIAFACYISDKEREVDGERDKITFDWVGGQVSEMDKQFRMKQSIFGNTRSVMN